MLVDRNMFIISFSDNTSMIWDSLFSTKLVKNENLKQHLPEIILEPFQEAFSHCLKSEHVFVEQLTPFPSGESYNVHINLNPVTIDDNVPYVMLCLQNNIDKRNPQATHQETLANYAHLTSHKLRAPLSNIISLSNSIHSFPNYEPEIVRTLLADITKQAENLDATIYALNNLMAAKSRETAVNAGLPLTKIKKIVLIDDEVVVNKIHQKLLSTHFPNVSIEIFTKGADALTFLMKNHADLVILDIKMPEIDGWQVLDTLRAEQIMINVVVLSSSVELSEKKRAFNYENVKFVMAKPLTRDQLLTIIQDPNFRTDISH